MRPSDFLDEFVKALEEQLEKDHEKEGNTWRKRVKLGHENQIYSKITEYYDQWLNAGRRIPWLKIAGLALIAWIRETQSGWAIIE